MAQNSEWNTIDSPACTSDDVRWMKEANRKRLEQDTDSRLARIEAKLDEVIRLVASR